jgi:hypothetical protein
MALLGCLSLIYDSVVASSVAGSMLLLVVIGFCIYGPQVLLVGTAPADLAHRGTSAAAAGFVNFMGYMGAATGDVVTGYYSAAEHGGWQTAIYIWAGWAFAGAAIMAILWNTTSEKVGLVPSVVPKLGAMMLLAGAAVAARNGGQPIALQVASIVAAILMIGTAVSRWGALPGLAVAVAGLMVVFLNYVQSSEAFTYSESAAMAAYGLAIISTTMVLVDQEGEVCESS